MALNKWFSTSLVFTSPGFEYYIDTQGNAGAAGTGLLSREVTNSAFEEGLRFQEFTSNLTAVGFTGGAKINLNISAIAADTAVRIRLATGNSATGSVPSSYGTASASVSTTGTHVLESSIDPLLLGQALYVLVEVSRSGGHSKSTVTVSAGSGAGDSNVEFGATVLADSSLSPIATLVSDLTFVPGVRLAQASLTTTSQLSYSSDLVKPKANTILIKQEDVWGYKSSGAVDYMSLPGDYGKSGAVCERDTADALYVARFINGYIDAGDYLTSQNPWFVILYRIAKDGKGLIEVLCKRYIQAIADPNAYYGSGSCGLAYDSATNTLYFGWVFFDSTAAAGLKCGLVWDKYEIDTETYTDWLVYETGIPSYKTTGVEFENTLPDSFSGQLPSEIIGGELHFISLICDRWLSGTAIGILHRFYTANLSTGVATMHGTYNSLSTWDSGMSGRWRNSIAPLPFQYNGRLHVYLFGIDNTQFTILEGIPSTGIERRFYSFGTFGEAFSSPCAPIQYSDTEVYIYDRGLNKLFDYANGAMATTGADVAFSDLGLDIYPDPDYTICDMVSASPRFNSQLIGLAQIASLQMVDSQRKSHIFIKDLAYSLDGGGKPDVTAATVGYSTSYMNEASRYGLGQAFCDDGGILFCSNHIFNSEAAADPTTGSLQCSMLILYKLGNPASHYGAPLGYDTIWSYIEPDDTLEFTS